MIKSISSTEEAVAALVAAAPRWPALPTAVPSLRREDLRPVWEL